MPRNGSAITGSSTHILCSSSRSGKLPGMLPNRLWRLLSEETAVGGISVNES